MASGEWLPPQDGSQLTATQGVQHGWRGAAYELRPLSLGEILDRTFAVYRANFWLFVGIAAFSGAVQFVASSIQLLVYRGVAVRPLVPGRSFSVGFYQGLRQNGSGSVAGLLFFLAAAVTQAATVWALSEVYLGRPATIGSSIRAVIGRWYRYMGIGLWQLWSFLWVPLLLMIPAILILVLAVPRHSMGLAGSFLAGVLIFLAVTGGFAYGVFAFLRNSLGVQASVVEQLKVRTSMRRSKVLTKGTKGRIFVVFLIGWCLLLVAGLVQAPLTLIVAHGLLRGERHMLAQAGMLVINFFAHVLVSPVVLIGMSLVYFDQRVRQEALDLLLMLGGGPGHAAGAPPEMPMQRGEPGPAADATAL